MDTQVFHFKLNSLKGRIKSACSASGRNPDEVTLMAVTKTHGPDAVELAAGSGLSCVGENRVQEAAAKKPQVQAQIRWELIGHLQRNKARIAVELFDRVQSVDRISLIESLSRICEEAGRGRLPVLLQINAGEDPRKFGVAGDEAAKLLEAALEARFLCVEGLMTIAPLSDEPDVSRRCFGRLREIRDELEGSFKVSLPELSMGMTGDLEDAIAMGSTLVRVGTALFGER